MLTQLNDANKKQAMGFLSYVSTYKEINRLQEEIQRYEDDEDRYLFLYREQADQNFIGVIGISKDDENQNLVVREIALSPSYRGTGYSHRMIDDLVKKYPDYSLSGTLESSPFIEAWAEYSHNESIEDE